MRRSHTALLISLPVLLIPAFTFGMRWYQSAKLTNYNVGGFKDSKSGERAAMKRLAQVVREGRTSGRVRVLWTVTVPSPASQRGTAMFNAVFESDYNRLYKSVLPPKSGQHAMVTQYAGVEDTMLSSIAAEGGLAEDLVRHGATLYKQGAVSLDAQGHLMIQW